MQILLVGTYSSLNKGDQLMQAVFAQQCFHQVPNCQISLATPFPEIDSRSYPGIKLVKANRRNLPLSAMIITLLMLCPRPWRSKLAVTSELKAYVEADLVVDLSGDMLTEDYGFIVAISHSIPLWFARLLGKNYVVCAQSIGHFKLTKALYKWLLSSATQVLPREELSADYLKTLQLNNVQQVDDLGFLLEGEPQEPVIQRPYFSVAPSGLLLKKFKAAQNSDEVLNGLAKSIDEIAQAHDLDVLLVSHVQTPSRNLDDDHVCQKLAELLQANCRMLDPALSPSQTKYHLSKSKFVIAYRMHAAIAALSTFTPTLAISYSHKTIGIMNRLNQKKWVMPNTRDTHDRLPKYCEEILENHDVIVRQLKEVMPEVKDNALNAINLSLKSIDHA